MGQDKDEDKGPVAPEKGKEPPPSWTDEATRSHNDQGRRRPNDQD